MAQHIFKWLPVYNEIIPNFLRGVKRRYYLDRFVMGVAFALPSYEF